jgi:hypothetical protein
MTAARRDLLLDGTSVLPVRKETVIAAGSFLFLLNCLYMDTKTENYYTEHAQEYCKNSFTVDLSYPIKRFTFYLHPGMKVLVPGCGSGRDSIALAKAGLDVESSDGNAQIARIAEKNTGKPVEVMTFDQMEMENMYEGIFANACLLHEPYKDLSDDFRRIFTALKKEGIFYASFKLGDFEGMREGRYYTDLNEERLLGILKPMLSSFTVLEIWHSHDAMKRNVQWFNFILRKVKDTL